MRLEKLFKVLGIVVLATLLNGCNSLKEPPDVDLCTLIADQNGDYAFCVSYFYEGREYRLPAKKVFDDSYLAISPDHFGEIQKYVEYLERQARRRCK